MSIKESTAKKNYSNKPSLKDLAKEAIKKIKVKKDLHRAITKKQIKSLQKKFSLPGKKSAHPGGGSYGYKFYKD